MTNIIQFPARGRQGPALDVVAVPARHDDAMKKILSGIGATLQVVLMLLWPLLRWVLAIDVAWQFFRMLYHWNTPGVHAGWTFLAHFLAFVVITYLVSASKPAR